MADQEETYYTPAEVAAKLRVSSETVMRALRSGALVGTKFRRQWRISKTALEEYLGRKTDPKRSDLLAVS
jgi:excisionase family DNA binding protein